MTTKTEDITFTDPAVQACPFHAYKRLHEHARVHKDPVTGFYEVSGFDDLASIVQDPTTFSSEHKVFGDKSQLSAHDEIRRLYTEEGFPIIPTLINADEPAHRMYRRLVDTSFMPARVKALKPSIVEITARLIDAFGSRGRVEFVGEFAMLLPLYVIADTIGVTRERALDFKRWSDAMIKVHEPGITTEVEVEHTHVVLEMQQFFAAEYERAKAEPGDTILGDLVRARIDGGREVTPAEAVNLLSSILVAGNETTTNAIASSMRRIIETPVLEDTLRHDKDKLPAFVEEALRLDSPLQVQFRRNVKEVTIAGVVIPADSMIVLRFGAGNRDELRFENADRIDLSRERVRQHLAFGSGIHMCVGHLLARAELTIAFEMLFERMRNFRVDGEVTTLPSFITYGPRTLPIAFDAA